MHARWLIAQKFHHPAQQIVFQDHIEVINAAGVRLAALEQQLRDIVPSWTMAPLVAAYQALRGVSFLVAATSPKTGSAPMWPLQTAHRKWQEARRRDNGDRPRDGRLSVVYRATS
jgi:hypothetical protein